MTALAAHRQLSSAVRPRAAARLRQFGDAVRLAFPGMVTQVVLFGSRARGDARRESDYDVAVVFKDLPDRRSIDHTLADIAYPHILAGIHIRPVSLPESCLTAPQHGSLSLNIARDGVVVTDVEG